MSDDESKLPDLRKSVLNILEHHINTHTEELHCTVCGRSDWLLSGLSLSEPQSARQARSTPLGRGILKELFDPSLATVNIICSHCGLVLTFSTSYVTGLNDFLDELTQDTRRMEEDGE